MLIREIYGKRDIFDCMIARLSIFRVQSYPEEISGQSHNFIPYDVC